jgi:hypothetical protein
MKNQTLLLIILLSISTLEGKAQKILSKTPITTTNEGSPELAKERTVEFYKFDGVPAFLEGSYLVNPAVTNMSVNPTDSKISFQGGAKFKTDKDDAFFYKVSAAAEDGIVTLWKDKSFATELQGAIGANFNTKRSTWVSTGSAIDIKKKNVEKGKLTSERVWWMNIRGEFTNNANLKTFDTSKLTAKEATVNQNFNGGSIILSWNNYFNTIIKKYTMVNHIFSAGVGYATSNNYTTLDKKTLYSDIQNLPSSTTFLATTKTGRMGNYKIIKGWTFYTEVYKPLRAELNKKVTYYIGVRYHAIGIGSSNFTQNINGGFFINFRGLDKNDEPAGRFKDKFSLAFIVGKEDNYFVNVGANFPLLF